MELIQKPLLRLVTLTSEYQALSTDSCVASVCLSALPTNSGPVYLEGEGGDVPIQANEWHEFARVDLRDLRVKGTPGDQLTVIGTTDWR